MQCRQCGQNLEPRTSKKTGRTYYVDAGTGQYHTPTCPARKQRTESTESTHTMPTTTHETVKASIGIEPTPRANGDLASIIAHHVASLMPTPTATMDEDRVRQIVRETSSSVDIVVSVRGSDAPPINVGRQHAQFSLLLAIVARRRNVWMVGPAGSGKTTAGHAVAKALSLRFFSISVGPQTTQSQIFGFMVFTANDAENPARYVSTVFRDAYQNGGVFLIDEIDRGNPGVLTALNQAIENGLCAFPDGMIQKHPDFVVIAAANTYGTGASREYVGALQLDAATLDRFVMVPWNYDESLETDIAVATFTASGGTDMSILTAWLAKVRHARERIAALKLRQVVSPRASIVGADLLASGIDEATVAACVLYKGMDADTIERIS